MKKASPPKIRVGCGSWSDDAYVGLLSPKGTPAGRRLAEYAQRFDHVEINSSYYATPTKETTAKWVEATPPGFLFDIKLHRAFSQSPEKTAKEGKLIDYLLKGVAPLVRTKRLGAFLLVLDPRFGPERHRLKELDALTKALQPHMLAVELRDAAWIKGKQKEATLEYFREQGLVWVIVDMPRIPGAKLMPPVHEVTQPRLAYLRLHGRNKKYLEAASAAERHLYAYDTRELKQIATQIRRLAAKAKNIRVVANNHANDFAPKTAIALKKILGQDTPFFAGDKPVVASPISD